MNSNYSKIRIPIALLAAILFAIILFRSFWTGPSDNSIANGRSAPQPSSKALVFTRSGISRKIVDAVEAVIRPRQAAAALCEMPAIPAQASSRFICVLVEAPGAEKYFQLDRDLTVEQFPFLKKLDFLEPPFQVSRSMSTYRSEAKRVLNFNELTDRLLLLICPKSEWAQLNIICPELNLPMPHVPSVPAGDPNAKDRF